MWGKFRGSLDRLVFFVDYNAIAITYNIKLIVTVIIYNIYIIYSLNIIK